MTTYYDILGVNQHATPEEIKQAYRELARRKHPDSFREALARAKETGNRRLIETLEEKILEATEEFKIINEAYEILSDPVKRRQYDELVANHARGAAANSHESSSSETPPNIRVSKTMVDFGQPTQGEVHSDSFIIYNDGGPVFDVVIGWVDTPTWAEARVVKDPATTFPIRVTVELDSTRASLGRNAAAIVILVNGVVSGMVSVIATVVARAPEPQARPVYTQTPNPPRPSPAPTPSKKTTGGASIGCGLVVILGGIVGVILLIAVIGSINGTNNSGNVPQSNQQSASNEQAEVQRIISNPASIITVTRIRSVDCKEASELADEPYYPCEYTWAEYKLTNNSQHLAVSVTGSPLTNDKGRFICSGNNQSLENDPNLREGLSLTLYCEESHLGKPMPNCGLVNAWRWDGNYWQKILSNDQRVCWNR